MRVILPLAGDGLLEGGESNLFDGFEGEGRLSPVRPRDVICPAGEFGEVADAFLSRIRERVAGAW